MARTAHRSVPTRLPGWSWRCRDGGSRGRCEDARMGAVDTPVPPVGGAEVRAGRELLTGVVSATPMAGSRALSELCGGPVWLKCENLQRTGSFKIRGAYTRIARLDPAERSRGVVAASAGNHAQGVALAARMLGTR